METRPFGVYGEEVRSSPLAAAADLTYPPRAKAALSPPGFYSRAAPAARHPPRKIKRCQRKTRHEGLSALGLGEVSQARQVTGELTASHLLGAGWISSELHQRTAKTSCRELQPR